MALSLGYLRNRVQRRLGDTAGAIWSDDEVDRAINDAYALIAHDLRVFWDWLYSENLPRGFSYTQPWEAEFLDRVGMFDYGCANYTAEFEKDYLPEDQLIGPANHTCPDEISHLEAVDASTEIPATFEVPEELTELSRATYNWWAIAALTTRDMRSLDNRYRTTQGEVYGLLWEFDGIRTLRKVRVPAQMGDVIDAIGAWGILRDPSDLTTDTADGSWGIPRRIPGQHPLGTKRFGLPRRIFLDEMNVRIEHWREGSPMELAPDTCELPDRYALYLTDYAQARCLERAGPGQDLQLSQHFDSRFARGLARMRARMTTVTNQRVGVMGGSGEPLLQRPPRPALPWNYGAVVR